MQCIKCAWAPLRHQIQLRWEIGRSDGDVLIYSMVIMVTIKKEATIIFSQ